MAISENKVNRENSTTLLQYPATGYHRMFIMYPPVHHLTSHSWNLERISNDLLTDERCCSIVL